MRKKTFLSFSFFVFCFSFFSSLPWAQTDKTAFQSQQFRPWMDPDGLFHTPSAKTLGQWKYVTGLYLNYGLDPITARSSDRLVLDQRIIGHQLGLDLGFGIGLLDWLDVYLVLPVTLYQTGKIPQMTGFGSQAGLDSSGFFLSDLKLGFKFRALQERKHTVNLAFQLHLTAPTALLGAAKMFNGEDTISGGLTVLLGKSVLNWLDLHFSLGYQYLPRTELTQTIGQDAQNLVMEHELNYTAGVHFHVMPVMDVLVEWIGRMSLNNPFLDATNLEMLLGARFYPLKQSKELAINAGVGFPLYSGVGSPLFRVFAGLVWSPPKSQDSDKDGVLDKEDKCPNVAGPKENAGCPWGDKDGDGITDNIDKCPDVKGPKENAGCPWGDRDKDGVLDNVDKCPDKAGPKENQGCPWGDKDGDGIPDNLDKCPDKAGPKENEGCPDKDKDGDGVVDRLDHCPNVPGVMSNNGCPRVVLVKVTETKILILKKIFFDFSSSKIQSRSFEVLDQVAEVLTKNPRLQVRVEGHTDNVGPKWVNWKLSRQRAKSVLQYLVKKGVSTQRLTSKGYAFSKPLVPNTSSANRSKNRRVEFTILSR